jgi:hypothetical protein
MPFLRDCSTLRCGRPSYLWLFSNRQEAIVHSTTGVDYLLRDSWSALGMRDNEITIRRYHNLSTTCDAK